MVCCNEHKWGRSILLALTFVLSGLCIRAQNVSNRGTEFWVGYGHHQFMETGSNDMNMVLYLSAEDQPATVTVTIDSSGLVPAAWWRKTYTIPAYTVIKSDIIPKGIPNVPAAPGDPNSDPNYDARLYTDPPPAGTGGAGVFRKKGIHIESNVPIVAYAHIYGIASSGATGARWRRIGKQAGIVIGITIRIAGGRRPIGKTLGYNIRFNDRVGRNKI